MKVATFSLFLWDFLRVFFPLLEPELKARGVYGSWCSTGVTALLQSIVTAVLQSIDPEVELVSWAGSSLIIRDSDYTASPRNGEWGYSNRVHETLLVELGLTIGHYLLSRAAVVLQNCFFFFSVYKNVGTTCFCTKLWMYPVNSLDKTASVLVSFLCLLSELWRCWQLDITALLPEWFQLWAVLLCLFTLESRLGVIV